MPNDFGVWKPPSGEPSISSIADFSPQALSELRAHFEASDPLRIRAANIIGIKNYVERLDVNTIIGNVSNTTTETSVYSYDIPAGMLQTKGALSSLLTGTFLNDTAGNNDLTVKVKYGATTIWGDVFSVPAGGAARQFHLDFGLRADNSKTAQRLGGWIALGAIGTPLFGSGRWTNDLVRALISGVGSENSDTKLKLDVTVTLGVASAAVVFIKKYGYTLRIAH